MNLVYAFTFANMIKSIKRITLLIISVAVLFTNYSCHKPSGGYNPYLHKKEKLSIIELHKQRKADRLAKRAYRKQMRQSSQRLYGRKPGPKKE